MGEIWKDIKNYKDIYECSNFGNIRSKERTIKYSDGRNRLYKSKILKGRLSGPKRRQYLNVRLYKNGVGKEFRIHRLVYQSFIGDIKGGYIIDHIDNNSLNNNLDNLQSISYRENNTKDQKNQSSELVGAHYNKNKKKWTSSISIKGKRKHLGYFTTQEEASESYHKSLSEYSK